MPRHLSLVAYNTPPTPASQDHSSCETFASTPLRLNSPQFHSHVGPPISSRAPPRLTPSAIFIASLACESLMNGSFVLSLIAKRAAVATKGAKRRDVSPKCWNGGRGGSAASGVSATLQVHSRSFTCDSFHSSLLRRGATEPPDSHSPPLHVLHVLHG